MEPAVRIERFARAKKQKTDSHSIFPINSLPIDLIWKILSLLKPYNSLGIYTLNSRERMIQWINQSKRPLDSFPKKLVLMLLKTHGHLLEYYQMERSNRYELQSLFPFFSTEKLHTLVTPILVRYQQNPPIIPQIAYFTRLRTLELGVMDPDEWTQLGGLSVLTDLTHLTMRYEDMTLINLSSWSALTNLSYLKLDHCDVSLENMEIICSLPRLKKISLHRLAQKEHIPLIGQITSLTKLNLNWVELKGANFTPLYQLTNLRVLKMRSISLTEEELQPFKSMQVFVLKTD